MSACPELFRTTTATELGPVLNFPPVSFATQYPSNRIWSAYMRPSTSRLTDAGRRSVLESPEPADEEGDAPLDPLSAAIATARKPIKNEFIRPLTSLLSFGGRPGSPMSGIAQIGDAL